MNLTCNTCGRIGTEDDGIEPGGPCQEPCDGTVRFLRLVRVFIVVTPEPADDDEAESTIAEALRQGVAEVHQIDPSAVDDIRTYTDDDEDDVRVDIEEALFWQVRDMIEEAT